MEHCADYLIVVYILSVSGCHLPLSLVSKNGYLGFFKYLIEKLDDPLIVHTLSSQTNSESFDQEFH